MRDPLAFLQVPALSRAVEPLAERLAMPTLPLHIHEVVGAALLYTFIQVVVSPVVSNRFFPQFYPRHNRAKKANWDTHVVSLVQSVIINVLALWVMYADEERKAMDQDQRVWGYTGGCGLIQALAAGYFVWDLGITVLNFDIFGLGMLAHALSALTVYTFGFRPYLNYYSTVFILYELSTPFLNIHWFCDKLNMTGSKPQLYNGIALLVTFFLCRLVWGTWQSFMVYADMWHGARGAPSAAYIAEAFADPLTAADPDQNIMYFARDAASIPLWLTLLYLASNVVLNTLNWYWFVKMVKAVRKRFEPPVPGKRKSEALPADAAPRTRASAVEDKDRIAVRQRRAHSIEDVVPDSEELREGTIQ
ncbi:TLC domain-containing protein [Chaetomidium leptoderma]|uniref:TLC domain-containing protein n=1 Tax=Chaetomidium leptoderma TaxID=669021 RepID=A0AAN6VIN4_9PEZI|nr:TLC domain-containing protein [Chaetomidium leptoderma]